MEQGLPSPEPAPENLQEFVVKAEPIDELSFDDKKYQFTVDSIGTGEIMISVFNSESGLTYKTTIKEDSSWYKSNIYIFRGEFWRVLSILKDSLIKDIEIFKHNEVESNDELKVTINYENEVYPFTLEIKIPKHVSENGPLEDKVNILEYQVKLLTRKLNDAVKGGNLKEKNKIYNEIGNLIYHGKIKNGKRHGKGIEYSSLTGLKKYEGEFKDGYYDGEGNMYNDVPTNQSVIYKALFRKGVVFSKIENYGYTSNGDRYIQESITLDARRKKYSLGKTFYEDGTLHRETNYKDGKKEGKETVYHLNGNKSGETNYKDGKKEGKESGFVPNGKISSELNYVNGKEDGIQKSYNGYQEKGKKSWLQLEWEMKDGVKHGYYKQFNEIAGQGDGGIISEQKYCEGEIM